MPLEPITDPSIKIKPSRVLIDYIVKNVKNCNDLPENLSRLKNSAKDKHLNCFLSLSNIKWLKEYLGKHKNQSAKKKHLHELLSGILVILPQPTVTLRNPELEERIKKLKAQQNNREYQAMTKGVDPVRKYYPEETIAYQIKAMNKQLIAVAQFIFSVAAGFAFGFIGVELIVGNLDFGFRLLLGIICALVIALAEIYFLAKKLNEDYDEPQLFRPNKLHQE